MSKNPVKFSFAIMQRKTLENVLKTSMETVITLAPNREIQIVTPLHISSRQKKIAWKDYWISWRKLYDWLAGLINPPLKKAACGQSHISLSFSLFFFYVKRI